MMRAFHSSVSGRFDLKWSPRCRSKSQVQVQVRPDLNTSRLATVVTSDQQRQPWLQRPSFWPGPTPPSPAESASDEPVQGASPFFPPSAAPLSHAPCTFALSQQSLQRFLAHRHPASPATPRCVPGTLTRTHAVVVVLHVPGTRGGRCSSSGTALRLSAVPQAAASGARRAPSTST